MPPTRRETPGLRASFAASSALPTMSVAAAASARKTAPINHCLFSFPVVPDSRGPHQVRDALSRGHKLTLFNPGRRPKQWPAAVEENHRRL